MLPRERQMALEQQRKHKYYRIHRYLDWVAGVGKPRFYQWIQYCSRVGFLAAVGFLALIQFCDPQGQQLPDWWTALLGWIHQRRFAFAVILLLAQAVLQVLIWTANWLKSYDVKKLENILDNLVASHFTNQDKSDHIYRATLFKVRSWPCCGKWLGIVARSGTRYSRKRTVFSINPNTKRYNTGIAGECWRRDGQTVILEIPVPKGNSLAQGESDDYKKSGYLDGIELGLMNVKATVFMATGIRVGGKVWGILVLDSTDPKQQPKSKPQERRSTEALEFAAVALGQLAS